MQLYSSFSDDELAELLNQGDQKAFREIYCRYFSKVYRAAKNRMRIQEECEEIVQEIFSNLWKRRSGFKLAKNFDSYFSVAVKYEVINRLAKLERIANAENYVAGSFEELDNSLVNHIDFSQLRHQVNEAIKELPDKCSTVFRMRHEMGYSPKEISDLLNLSVKTIEAHLTKARKILKHRLTHFFGIVLAALLYYL